SDLSRCQQQAPELEIPRFGRPPSQLLPAGGGAGPSSGLQSHAMLDFRRTRWRQRNLMSMTDDELRPFIGVSRLLPPASSSASTTRPDPDARRDFTDQQQPQQPQLYADYRRRSLTADSDTTSLGRGRDGAKGTTPVGSYISGVLGGSLHPGLAADDLADDAEAADVQDEDAKSAADSASEAVVRLRAENARWPSGCAAPSSGRARPERERLALAERALATAGELDDARESCARGAAAGGRLETAVGVGESGETDPSESPQSPPGSSLDAELERANRRAGSLERSLQEMQRRLLLAESRQVGADNEAAAAAASDDLEAAPSTRPWLSAPCRRRRRDLRADSEALRRRAARDELARKRRLEEVEEKAADGQRASEEALLSVSLGLESARAQNAELRQLLERSEAGGGTESEAGEAAEDFGQLQESQSGLEAWAPRWPQGARTCGSSARQTANCARPAGLAGARAGRPGARSCGPREPRRRGAASGARRLAEEAARELARPRRSRGGRGGGVGDSRPGCAREHRSLRRRRLGAAAEAAEAAGAAKAPEVDEPAKQPAELESAGLQAELRAKPAGSVRSFKAKLTGLAPRIAGWPIEKLTETRSEAQAVPGQRGDAPPPLVPWPAASRLRLVTVTKRSRGVSSTPAGRTEFEQNRPGGARGDSLLALKRRQVQEAA
uniref:BZIP domain-containing protein n=1 Tax=Macrostomum lignano TaxID=282301 RepID=A0A1I8FFK7_9PLAT